MIKGAILCSLAMMILIYPVAQKRTDRERDGFIGPVKSYRDTNFRLVFKKGEWIEDSLYEEAIEEYKRSGYGLWGNNPAGVMGGYNISHAAPGRASSGEFISDDKGNWAETVHYSSDGQIVGREIFAHDSFGNRTEEKRFDKDGNLKDRTVFIYDSKGYRVEKSFFLADGELSTRWLYENDDRGNVIEERFFESTQLKEKRTFKYEFDTIGNWIKRTSYIEVLKGGRPVMEPEMVTRRKITYYKPKS